MVTRQLKQSRFAKRGPQSIIFIILLALLIESTLMSNVSVLAIDFDTVESDQTTETAPVVLNIPSPSFGKRPVTKPAPSAKSSPVGPSNQSQFCASEFAITNLHKCAKFEFSYDSTVGKDEPCVATASTNLTELSFPAPDPELANMPINRLTPSVRRIIEGITNTFENGTPDYAYGKCEHLDDGRGYTCGRIGFTTGTGDALWVVEKYVKYRPGVTLARYLPELRRLAALPSCDTTGKENIHNLNGFAAAWSAANQRDTALFRQIQDNIAEQHYLIPALKFAHKYGATTALSQAVFYDTVVQHGYASTEDNIDLQRILTLTGPRRTGETEIGWLDRFLVTRGQMLCCFPDSVWPASADRVHDLRDLLSHGKVNLTGEITLRSSGIQILAGSDEFAADARSSAIKIKKPSRHTASKKASALAIQYRPKSAIKLKPLVRQPKQTRTKLARPTQAISLLH